MNERLVSLDGLGQAVEDRGLFAIVDSTGGTLAVGYLEPDDNVALTPGSTVSLRFRVKGGIRE